MATKKRQNDKNDLQSTSQCNAMNNYQYMSIITTEERLYYSKIIRILKCVGHCRGVDKSFTFVFRHSTIIY